MEGVPFTAEPDEIGPPRVPTSAPFQYLVFLLASCQSPILSFYFFYIPLLFFFSCPALLVYVSIYLSCMYVCVNFEGKSRRRKSNSVATDPFICLNKYCSDNVPKDDGLRKIRDITEG